MADHIRLAEPMGRWRFLKAGLAAPLVSALSPTTQESWRTFDIDVHVDVLNAQGPVRIWLPLALARSVPYQQALAQTWTGNTTTVDLRGDPASGAPMLTALWPADVPDPTLTLTIRVATKGHRVLLSEGTARSAVGERLDHYQITSREHAEPSRATHR